MAVSLGVAVFLPLALWTTRFHLVPTAEGCWHGLSDPPGLVRLIAAAALAALVAWCFAGTTAAAPLLGLSLAAAPLVTALTGRFTGLLAFQGPALVVVAAALLGAAVARATPRPWLSRVRPGAATLFALTFAAYALLGLRLPGAAGPQGDEPHYLTMAQSLLSDGDLDLADEFRDREYASFFAGVLEPHTSPASPRGRLYSIHTPGLPALILPGYALGGFRGAQLLLSVVAALTSVVVFRVVAELSASPGLAYMAWALAAFAPPLPVYAVSIYPETAAALALAVFLWRARGANGWGALVAVAVLAALLPWLHPKFLPLAAAGVAFVVARPGPRRARGLAVALPLLSLLALLAWFKATYGQASLAAAYGPGFASDVRLFNLPWGLLGLLFDRQFGLLVVAPVFLLAVPGALALARERRGDTLRTLVLVGATVGVGASFSMWWGGSCPPARFMVPAVPALAVLAAFAARAARVWAGALAGASFSVLALAAEAPRALHNRPDGESGLLRFLAPALDLDGALPSFVLGGRPALVLGAALLIALALAWAASMRGAAVGLVGATAGLVGYGTVATVLRDRPFLDQRLATEQLLTAWDEDNLWSAAGPPTPASLAIPLDLPGAPWLRGREEARLSRPLDLPPGLYHLALRAESRAIARDASAVARIELRSGALLLAAAPFEAGASPPTLMLPLPAGVRRLTLRVPGLEAGVTAFDARLVPEVLVPRRRRAELTWPRLAEPDRYRVGPGPVKTTALDRSAPEGEGFVLDGDEGHFVVDAAPSADVVVRLRRTRPSMRDVLFWGQRRVPLGRSPEVVLHLGMEEGEPLGPLRVVPVRVRAGEAWVAFSSAGS